MVGEPYKHIEGPVDWFPCACHNGLSLIDVADDEVSGMPVAPACGRQCSLVIASRVKGIGNTETAVRAFGQASDGGSERQGRSPSLTEALAVAHTNRA